MVVAALTVAENFATEKQAFIKESPAWADPAEANFRKIINDTLKEYFGISSKEQLKEATRLVTELQGKARDDLSTVKTEIERGFRTNKPKSTALLETLGYKQYWKKASNRNQTELIGLLLKFDNNLSAASRAEMVANKVNDDRITSILAFAKSLHEANISQETLKGTSKVDTAAAVSVFNEIYDQAMDICVVGQRLFKKDKVRKDMFVFAQLVKKQGLKPGNGGSTDDGNTTPPKTKN